ncbi:MAG TPA: protoporphyrinogen oxidase [Acidobacteriaceae bacterium]
MKNVVIIGGGITGLAAAYYLQQHAHGAIRVTLIESSSRLGGKITSVREDGFLIEGGPDSFITQKAGALALCRELGLDGDLTPSNTAHKTTYVVSGGKLHAMPEGMMLMAPTMMIPFLRSGLISWPGKMRMGMEMFLPRRDNDGDESLSSFITRRLGAEALDKLAGPLIGGIYAADPEKLSLRSTFPMFLEMEKKYGSLLRGMLRRKKAAAAPAATQAAPAAATQPAVKRAPMSMFMTLRGGLQQLVDTLVARIDPASILLGRQILPITPDAGGYRIDFSDGDHMHADEVLFATPAHVTGDLLTWIDPQLSVKLHAIRYVSTATVSLAYKVSDLGKKPDGFGFVVPHSERRKITACSWSSTKFDHRAPEDGVLLRVFVGGDRAQELAELSEEALAEMAREELRITMGITATPVLTKVYRWCKGNPQYDVGHLDRVEEIDGMAAKHPGLHLAGAAFRGAGIPDCIQSALKVATEITEANQVTRKEAV